MSFVTAGVYSPAGNDKERKNIMIEKIVVVQASGRSERAATGNPNAQGCLEASILELAQAHSGLLKYNPSRKSLILVIGGKSPLIQRADQTTTEFSYVDGRRFIKEPELDLTVKVFDTVVNDYAEMLEHAGMTSYVAGSSSEVLTAEIDPVKGFKGKNIEVNTHPLLEALEAKKIPVVASIGTARNDSPQRLVLEDDDVAGSIASTLAKEGISTRLVMATDTGVRDSRGRVLTTMSFEQYQMLVSTEAIRGGMKLKLDAAFRAHKDGAEVFICHYGLVLEPSYYGRNAAMGTELIKENYETS